MTRITARFDAPWWAGLLALAGIALGVTAGTWQLRRADYKRELLAAFARNSPADNAGRLPGDREAASARYRRLALDGHYDPGRQVLLDNMSLHGLPGYEVLTPFITAGAAVLVNRGWVPASGDRSVLPDVTVGNAERHLTGRIDELPRPGLSLPADIVAADSPWPRRLLFPTAAEIAAHTGYDLRHYQLLLDADQADGYAREWQPGGMGPERHIAYAVQWFGLALTAGTIYVVMGWKKASRKKP